MPAEQSSWRVASWVTPQTEVTVDPIDASVSPESRTKVSDRLEEQIPQFIRDDYPDFVQFIKYYYQALELKGNPVDVINNLDEYYNIDRLNDLVITEVVNSTDNILQFSVIPESNDLVSLRETYLTLGIDNLVVNVIDDEISSGSNTSGTGVVPESSYS